MKTCAIAFLLIILGLGIVNAQYKINKTKYDYRSWTYQEGDPYNPTTCGILSIIPGVGQMVAGDIGRGIAFLGGCLGCFAFTIGGFSVAWGPSEELGVAMMLAGLGGMAAIDICAIVDATRVAKVNNLVWRDNNTGFRLHIEPYFSPVQTYSTTRTQIGLSLKVNF